jgi:hypothetical protein
MSLLEIYKEKNKNTKWFTDHSTLGKGATGRMFEYTNTNFRTQNAFTTQFRKFLEIENKDRETWSKQEHHGQEMDKHRVVNMIQSKLFKKDVNELYSRTAKGLLYSDFINLDSPEDDKWLVNYLFLLNGYYLNRKNYIVYRVKQDLLGYLLSVDGVSEDLLIEYAKELLGANSLAAMLRSRFFFIHSFYDDSDFLINYLRAPDAEKEELVRYIEENLRAENFVCCISKKYQPSGNFNQSMLQDETRVFLLTLLFIQSKDANLSNIYEIFVRNFNQNIAIVNEASVLGYLRDNKNIFDPIFAEILELGDLEIAVSDTVSVGEAVQILESDTGDKAEEYIDETSEIGRQKIKAVYNIRKRQARIQSEYKCALETINNCRPVYFTAKVTGKNYLELHHFIPREFRNDFSYSIEVLANYVTLCPRCHRQIHLAVDRERKHLINSLYEERKDRLQVVGLGLDLKGVYAYYKVDP